MKKIVALSSLLVLSPIMVMAQGLDTSYVDQLIQFIADAITTLVPLIIAIAVLLFLWGLVGFILSADDEDARKAARSRMIWGIIIIFVMVSLWGLVNLLDSFFGLSDTVQSGPSTPTVPSIQ